MHSHTSSEKLAEIKNLKNALGNSSDLLTREVRIEEFQKTVFILFIDGIVDNNAIQEYLIEPIMRHNFSSLQRDENILSYLKSSIIPIKSIHQIKEPDSVQKDLLLGRAIVMLEGEKQFLSVDTTKWSTRALTSPQGQRVNKGPNVGFSEDRITNISLVRKIIKNKNLYVHTKSYGKSTQTDVSLMYLNDRVDQNILKEIQTRLSRLDMDAILEANYIEEVLTKDSKSMFPLMLDTDRPDVVSAEILEGKIAIFIDGSPYSLIAPAVLIQFFQTPEDYYFNEKSVSSFRTVRAILFILSIYVPGLYVAFTTYHANLLPVKLLLGFVSQREVVPTPTILEVFILLLLVGAIFEGSTRLPQTVSLTISVFGAILFGQSIVEAQLVQPISLVVVSASFIMGSLVPIMSLQATTRTLKYAVIMFGATLGLFGISMFTIFLLLHLCSLRSFGVPYMAPFAPFVPNDQKDGAFRLSLEQITNDESSFTKEETMEKTDK